VALKVFRSNRFQRSITQDETFLNEARLARTLQHENLIQVFDVGATESGEPFFSTTLANGTLQPDLPFEENIEALISVGLGLDHLHSCGIVHCDVKPSNVLRVDADPKFCPSTDDAARKPLPPRWLLADLGLAWHRSSPVAVGSGSFGYIAPERFGSEPPTPRCDVFSYACLIERCLRKATSPYKFTCGQPLQAVLDAALSADPKKRPGRASDLAGLLHRRASRVNQEHCP
jgi:serine/threonine protein kinase